MWPRVIPNPLQRGLVQGENLGANGLTAVELHLMTERNHAHMTSTILNKAPALTVIAMAMLVKPLLP